MTAGYPEQAGSSHGWSVSLTVPMTAVLANASRDPHVRIVGACVHGLLFPSEGLLQGPGQILFRLVIEQAFRRPGP